MQAGRCVQHSPCSCIISSNPTTLTLPADAGIHGSFNAELGLLENETAHRLVTLAMQTKPDGRVSVTLTPTASTSRMRGHVPGDVSYLELLFDGSKVRFLGRIPRPGVTE